MFRDPDGAASVEARSATGDLWTEVRIPVRDHHSGSTVSGEAWEGRTEGRPMKRLVSWGKECARNGACARVGMEEGMEEEEKETHWLTAWAGGYS